MAHTPQQPVPEEPTNVQANNPYQGQDRGLFILHQTNRYARVHAARWVTVGPTSAIGRLEFQIMAYPAKPVAPEDYLAGELLTAPGGGQWFDCLTRGLVMTAIMAEYWGKNSYHLWYTKVEAQRLTTFEKETSENQAKSFTATMGAHCDLKGIEFVTTFNASLGQPLQVSSRSLTIDYDRFGTNRQDVITDFPSEMFDPVQFAMTYVKSLP